MEPHPARPAQAPGRCGNALEVFLAFLRLGLTSFGGPVAHLGYFRTEFVARRRWLDDRRYADLVALCQFLPGPASSQVGMALGLGRAGYGGLLAAWLGFTLPSALALALFAHGVTRYPGLAASGWVHGLKLVAVAIVAQAVWGMGKSLCPDPLRKGLAGSAALLVLAAPTAAGQLAAIAVSALLGRLLVTPPRLPVPLEPAWGVSRTVGAAALALFFGLLAGLPLLTAASGSPVVALLEGFYRSGALVFGGGHVVLPLLEAAVVPGGVVSATDFLAGYGAAQAVPGPLFTFAAYLGAVARGPLGGWLGAAVLLLTIFLPALLLVLGTLPFWEGLRRREGVKSAMAGISAGVVGLLAAALYDPLWTGAVHSPADFAVVVAAFWLLVSVRVPPVAVVALGAACGALMRV